jgi:hypothetical protein
MHKPFGPWLQKAFHLALTLLLALTAIGGLLGLVLGVAVATTGAAVMVRVAQLRLGRAGAMGWAPHRP